MACTTCQQNAKRNITRKTLSPTGITAGPFGARDIEVYDGKTTRRFYDADWYNNDHHKLLLFYPETFTPVCMSELGALNKWIDSFKDQNVDVYTVTIDPINEVELWYQNEPALGEPRYLAMSSLLLPMRLGLLDGNNNLKRASVFITNDGEVIKQEHFLKVGRSLAELHRMIYAYNTGSYCAEGWTSPADGFLEK